MNNFAVFILTNNRPDNVKTVNTLRKQGYTGKIILVLDDLDTTLRKYKENYPDCDFYIFNKQEAIEITDSADNTNNPRAVVYARNMCFKIASELGLEYFLELDDDYSRFEFLSCDKNIFKHCASKNLNNIFQIYIDFLKNTPAQTIAFLQGGDLIGGYKNSRFGMKITLVRKAMNSFFCKTDRPFVFYGLINEDVNMYLETAKIGKINFTSTHFNLIQAQTQKNSGGLTTIYLELGTYVKSFYSVIFNPSCVIIEEMGLANKRLHHRVELKWAYPKILSEKYKKVSVC